MLFRSTENGRVKGVVTQLNGEYSAKCVVIATGTNLGELRVKESDRLAAIIDGLALLGVDAWEEGDDLFVEGNPQLQVPEGLVFESHGDHRLAMTWALVGACGRIPVSVTDFTCVAVSYPDFLADLKELVK